MRNANQVFQGVSTERTLRFLSAAYATITKEHSGADIEFCVHTQPNQEMAILGHVTHEQWLDDPMIVEATLLTRGQWRISGHKVLGDLLLEHFNDIFK